MRTPSAAYTVATCVCVHAACVCACTPLAGLCIRISSHPISLTSCLGRAEAPDNEREERSRIEMLVSTVLVWYLQLRPSSTVQFLLRLQLEHPPQNLARHRLRYLVDKMHSTPQPLVVRHLGVQPRDDLLRLLLASPQPALRHDVGAGEFGGLLLVVHADDGTVLDVWVGDEEAL